MPPKDELYQHTPLSKGRCIRLLKLYPSEQPKISIRCSLMEVQLEHVERGDHPYEAVSYVWGTNIRDYHVFCRGKKIPVTRNCRVVLKRLRHASEPRLIWIDAICIDQSSVLERNHQVALMGDVYKLAKSVLIWLGRGDDETHRLVRQARELAAVKREIEEQNEPSAVSNEQQVAENFKHLPFSKLPVKWFRRAWTFQELVLARDPLVLCGPESMHWDDFVLWRQYSEKQDHLTISGRQIQNLTKSALVTRRGYHNLMRERLLQDHEDPERMSPSDLRDRKIGVCDFLIFAAFQRQASDLKDRVYSLYALLSDLGINIPAPDYNKDLPTVYQELIVSMVEYTGSLKPLMVSPESSPSRSSYPGWPTWVLNPSHVIGMTFTPPRVGRQHPGFRPGFHVLHQPGRITLEGIAFDTVKEMGQMLEVPPLHEIRIAPAATRWVSYLQAAFWLNDAFGMVPPAQRCPNGELATLAMVKAIIGRLHNKHVERLLGTKPAFGGPTFSHTCPDEEAASQMEAFVSDVAKLLRDFMANPGNDGQPVSLAQAARAVANNQDHMAGIDLGNLDYIGKLCCYCMKMTPFVSENGYVGIATGDGYNVGQQIVLLYGSHFPFIVEPAGQEYRLVNPVYMEGISESVWPPTPGGEPPGTVELMTFI
ncbi:heterokaryon incompatibility protein-domain-containing protein [Podospora aff. communis PSN243]|uniref:Heterokaryon incompatibility protein-domain-containing protein n=1 Tax=Podospora aff. communis PSN243 TaxID=3040156 RepID=A0AAV9G7G3_9PEZI|nr:heterokaryon incompatibility protein-domain-containing protein [Podospora aff. communis PSN243]